MPSEFTYKEVDENGLFTALNRPPDGYMVVDVFYRGLRPDRHGCGPYDQYTVLYRTKEGCTCDTSK